jgi:hypothetical protein
MKALAVGALDLFVQLGDGLGATPRISGVDLIAGTIFQPAHGGQFAFAENGDQLAYHAVTKAAGGGGPAIPNGPSLLATLWIVPAGAAEGVSLSLLLGGTGWGDTAFQSDAASPEPIAIGILNGTLTLVPEPHGPAAAAALGLAAFGLWRRARRA